MIRLNKFNWDNIELYLAVFVLNIALAYSVYKYTRPVVIVNNNKQQLTDTINRLTLTDNNVIYWITVFNIKHPNIVRKQIILESGYYKSRRTLQHNNIIGAQINDSTPIHYDNWIESLVAYKQIQKTVLKNRRLTDGEYLNALREYGYFKDPDYESKIRLIKLN
jgi:hypothetical protein